MQNVFSYVDFLQKMAGNDRVALLIHNPENEFSRCAFRSITEAMHLSQTISVFIADVSQVQDIHPVYEITSEPSLLLFVNGKLVSTVEGCHESDYFKAMINLGLPK
ncbi:MAG TPA: hypothetical protein DHV48_02075 [Prolixibacteraceae bacterium]|nr:hypothetical protein [Prolixibacteraceae bacterium]